MEPKKSMTAYAAVLTLMLALLALAGFATAATWTAIGLLGVAALLHAEYMRLKVAGSRRGRSVPKHRRDLDRLVLIQWCGASVTALVLTLLIGILEFSPLDNAGRLVDVLVVATVVASLGVFVSSLVDWYVILPKVSGLAGPAPCETVGGATWKYTTCIWYFHRSLATALVYLAATGVPAYMGGTTTGSATVAWGLLAAVIAIVGGYFFRAMFLAGWYAFNPPVLVGEQIYVEVPEEGDGDVAMRRRRAYVVDVSLQGAKYKVLQDGRFPGPPFADKSDGSIPNHRLAKSKAPTKSLQPICGKDRCTGVNWYCRHNAKAHE